jgi:D-sedoheptulose 7-phosphate isomerase
MMVTLNMELFEYLDQTIENIKASNTVSTQKAMEDAIKLAVEAIEQNRIIVTAGNGGSMADAQHMSGELVNYFTKKHEAFPVLTLGVNSSVSTAWANDFEFSAQFEREFSAYLRVCGLLVVFTTSGKSENINRLLERAKFEKIPTVAFASEQAIKNFRIEPDVVICPKASSTPRIQELHVNLMHYFCQEIENRANRQ